MFPEIFWKHLYFHVFVPILGILFCSGNSFTAQPSSPSLIPLRYELQIQLPTSSRKDPLIPAFFGSAKIEFQISRPLFAFTRRFYYSILPQLRFTQPEHAINLRFNAQNLENFENVTLHTNGRRIPINAVRFDTKHVVFVVTEHTLTPGRYVLSIERYTGIITYDKGIYYR